jgi:hypothetical protein
VASSFYLYIFVYKDRFQVCRGVSLLNFQYTIALCNYTTCDIYKSNVTIYY